MERDTNGLFVSVPDYEIVNIHHRRHRRSADADQIHQVDQSSDQSSLRSELFLSSHFSSLHSSPVLHTMTGVPFSITNNPPILELNRLVYHAYQKNKDNAQNLYYFRLASMPLVKDLSLSWTETWTLFQSIAGSMFSTPTKTGKTSCTRQTRR